MSILKTMVALLILLPLRGWAAEPTLTRDFATCAGRFSAELEHAWLLNDERTEDIERRRLTFIDLVNAMAPQQQLPRMLNLRIEAKMAHASLLTLATFSQDPKRAVWALRQAESQIAYCSGFLLES